MDLGTLQEISLHRTCLECGDEFSSTSESSALEKFSDHLAMHQPTVGQWSNAYTMIMRGNKKQ